jgi:hypothetical protein
MYMKDKNDTNSKEGTSRVYFTILNKLFIYLLQLSNLILKVALYKATQQPFFYTLEVNYNSSRYYNKINSSN